MNKSTIKFDDVIAILDQAPDYEVFLTVDELKANAHRLAARYPEVAQLLPIGHSRQGDAIEALKIGDGPKKALLFAMPHPNEPIGSMMLDYFSLRLAEDAALRDALGYTWYLISCVDPDGARLNEGWFKGPFSIGNYARNYYRPPSYQQVEWTFPIDYKTLHFHDPLPETQALMTIIEQVRPDFIYSLHNSGFGGAYFYLSREAPPLYELFYKLVASQGLPLHLGEPEMPYATQYAVATYKAPAIAETYDFLQAQTGSDPAEIMKGGTSSFDYARRFGDPFCLVCEMPYFYNPAIHDTSPSDMVRRDAILQMVERSKADLAFAKKHFDAVCGELTVKSPFHDSIEYNLQALERFLLAQENWAKTDLKTAETATKAEKFDNLLVSKFYHMLMLGMFARMLNTQIAEIGESAALRSAREVVGAALTALNAELDAQLKYSVIPIQKLVRVQLGSALLAADFVRSV